MSMLSVTPAHGLPTRAEEQRWLVKDLWSEEAVGIIGAEPKCCKTFLALDLAVAVAAGTPCLRRFPVSRAGRVLLYAAEDPLDMVRRRLEGICAATSLRLAELDIQVITEPTACGLISRPFVAASTRPLPSSGPVSLFSIPSCACIASMRTPVAKSRRYSLICGNCSGAMPSRCWSFITPRRAPAASAPARRCAALPNSTLGATPISICANKPTTLSP
jgi:hypothetical protein